MKIFSSLKFAAFLSSFLLIVIPFKGYCQKEKLPDSLNYFTSYVDKLVLGLNVDTQTDTYVFRDESIIDRLEISPNNQTRLSLSLDYKFLGVSIGFAPRFFNDKEDEKLKGKSSFTDYRFNFFFGRFVQSLQYRKIEGYYLVNTDYFFDDWKEGEDAYLQFPDLSKTVIGFSTGYIFNDKFSYRSLVGFTERQLISAGSLVPMLYYDYSRFYDMIMDEESVENQFNLRLAFGYYYTWVISKRWFITPGLAPSLGVRFSNFKDVDADGIVTRESNSYITRALDGGLQLGWNTDKFFGGTRLIFNINWYDENSESHVENNQVYGLVYLGYRLNAPRFIRRPMEDVENEVQKKWESLKKKEKN